MQQGIKIEYQQQQQQQQQNG